MRWNSSNRIKELAQIIFTAVSSSLGIKRIILNVQIHFLGQMHFFSLTQRSVRKNFFDYHSKRKSLYPTKEKTTLTLLVSMFQKMSYICYILRMAQWHNNRWLLTRCSKQQCLSKNSIHSACTAKQHMEKSYIAKYF